MTVHSLGVEVSCDGPDEQTDCPASAAVPIRFGSMTPRQVRADGREDGWTRRRRAGRLVDLCTGCAAP
ncbi:hypothetical protein [Streptomyces sp. NBC_01614]|uniref:hypothetical protein n=1 Tax=Streptomyces sp. NBC_01614 TaxID=2975897 RepID=UPI0038681793